MLLRQPAAYAVRALVWLARQPKNSRWLATEVAQREGIPHPYLSKVLGTLKSQGIVSSTRGPHGGYVLTRAPESISLLLITELFDSERRMNVCILAYGQCGECNRCPLGDFWSGTRASIRVYLQTTTIDALARYRSPDNPAVEDSPDIHE